MKWKMQKKKKAEICPTCERPFPEYGNKEVDPMTISISKFHIRCGKCLWPVAKNMAVYNGLCRACGKVQV